MTETPKRPDIVNPITGAFNPLNDLAEKARLRGMFPKDELGESLYVQQCRDKFSEFYAIWEPLLEYIGRARDIEGYRVGDKLLSGRIVYDSESEKIKIMVGFVQDGIVLNEDNAGLVMTAPISRVIDPEPKFLPDFEKGQTYGIYTNLQEKDMRNAMRYAVDLEKLSNYSERFPRVFTPVREQNFFEYMNLWIVEQVMGKSKNALDLSF